MISRFLFFVLVIGTIGWALVHFTSGHTATPLSTPAPHVDAVDSTDVDLVVKPADVWREAVHDSLFWAKYFALLILLSYLAALLSVRFDISQFVLEASWNRLAAMTEVMQRIKSSIPVGRRISQLTGDNAPYRKQIQALRAEFDMPPIEDNEEDKE